MNHWYLVLVDIWHCLKFVMPAVGVYVVCYGLTTDSNDMDGPLAFFWGAVIYIVSVLYLGGVIK